MLLMQPTVFCGRWSYSIVAKAILSPSLAAGEGIGTAALSAPPLPLIMPLLKFANRSIVVEIRYFTAVVDNHFSRAFKRQTSRR